MHRWYAGWLCLASVALSAEATAPDVLEAPAYCRIVGRREPGAALLPPAVTAVGQKRLIFFRARFPDDKEDPISEQEATQTLAEVSEVFTRVSYGKLTMHSTISPVLMLTKGREEYGGPGGFDRFLEDVRQAALAQGIDYRDFELDVVRHSGVPGFSGGNANLGYRGAQVQAPGATVIVHELGHNLGLPHANLWVTGNPGLSAASPPLPSNYETLPDARTIPVYPDSALGHESITGPGYGAEYGDTSDIMGSGSVEFSAIYRHYLGWLSNAEIADVQGAARSVRIQATDGRLTGLPRALRAGSPFHSPAGERQYWIQLPPPDPGGMPGAGVEVRWADPASQPHDSLLLTASANRPDITGGVLLSPGRTLSDPLAQVHITVVDTGGSGENRWAEVHIEHGAVSANQAPHVTLTASALSAGVDQPVTFAATASDSDADTLTWRWEFGDSTFSTDSGPQTKSWRREGDFVVSLEVSDRKGGVGRVHVPIRVGQPKTRRISGRVLDTEGNPVAGVRVHKGLVGPRLEPQRYVSTLTDSRGEYTLTGLESGTYTNGAYLFGYTIQRREPIIVADSDLTSVDFVATPRPQVSVSATVSVPESIGPTNLFVFTRTGSTEAPLTVLYRLSGTATAGRDYIRPLVDRVVIPAGARTASLLLDVQDDDAGEEDESITLEVAFPISASRQDGKGDLFTVYYPGWELAEVGGQVNWVLTEPPYLPGAGSSATVIVLDNDSAQAQLLSISASDLHAIEQPQVNSAFTVTRTGVVDQSVTAFLAFGGTAENGVDCRGLPDTLTFEPGETEKLLEVQPIADDLSEPAEELMATLLPNPAYGIEVASASVTIRDSPALPQTLSARSLADGTLQLVLQGQPGSRLILESKTGSSAWVPIRTNLLFNTSTASVTLPIQKQGHALFRTVRD
jgi:hypothetical protein